MRSKRNKDIFAISAPLRENILGRYSGQQNKFHAKRAENVVMKEPQPNSFAVSAPCHLVVKFFLIYLGVINLANGVFLQEALTEFAFLMEVDLCRGIQSIEFCALL